MSSTNSDSVGMVPGDHIFDDLRAMFKSIAVAASSMERLFPIWGREDVSSWRDVSRAPHQKRAEETMVQIQDALAQVRGRSGGAMDPSSHVSSELYELCTGKAVDRAHVYFLESVSSMLPETPVDLQNMMPRDLLDDWLSECLDATRSIRDSLIRQDADEGSPEQFSATEDRLKRLWKQLYLASRDGHGVWRGLEIIECAKLPHIRPYVATVPTAGHGGDEGSGTGVGANDPAAAAEPLQLADTPDDGWTCKGILDQVGKYAKANSLGSGPSPKWFQDLRAETEGIRTPGTGEKNFKFREDEVRLIVQHARRKGKGNSATCPANLLADAMTATS